PSALIYTLSLHDALPISRLASVERLGEFRRQKVGFVLVVGFNSEARVVVGAPAEPPIRAHELPVLAAIVAPPQRAALRLLAVVRDRKSTRLNSSHVAISY